MRLEELSKNGLEGRLRLIVKELRRFPAEKDMRQLDYWKGLLKQVKKEYGALNVLKQKGKNLLKAERHDFPAPHQWEAALALANCTTGKGKLIAYDTGCGKTAIPILTKELLEEKSSGEYQLKRALKEYFSIKNSGKRNDFANFLKISNSTDYSLLKEKFPQLETELKTISEKQLEYELSGENISKKTIQRELMKQREKYRTLVIVPNSLKEQWADKIREYLPKYARGKERDKIVIINGDTKEDALKKANNADFVIINYELVHRSDWDAADIKEQKYDEIRSRELQRESVHELEKNIKLLVRNEKKSMRILKETVGLRWKEKKRQLAKTTAKLEQLIEEESIVNKLSNIGFKILVSDEGHLHKNPQAYCSKAIVKIAKNAARVIPMTASAIPNSLEDIGVTAHILDSGRYKSINEFNIDHSRVPRMLAQFFKEYALMLDIDQIKDFQGKVPKLNEQFVSVDLNKNEKQKEVYLTLATKEIRGYHVFDKLILMQKAMLDPYLLSPEFFKEYAEENINGKKVEARRHEKLVKKIFADRPDLLQELHTMGSVKYDAIIGHDGIDGLVDSCIKKAKKEKNQSGKVVIFSSHFVKGVINKLRKKFEEKGYGVCTIDGSVKNDDGKDGNYSTRRKTILEFQTNPEKMIMIANRETAGLGIELTAGKTVINLDLPYVYEELKQGNARVRRPGNENDVVNCYSTIIDGIAGKESLDQAIMKVLVQKNERNQKILKNKFNVDPKLLESALERIAAHKEKPIAAVLDPSYYASLVEDSKKKTKPWLRKDKMSPARRLNIHLQHTIGKRVIERDRYIAKHGKDITADYNELFWFRYQSDMARLERYVVDGLAKEKSKIADLGSASGATAFVIMRPTYNVDKIPEMFDPGRRIVAEQFNDLEKIIKKDELEKRISAFNRSQNTIAHLQNLPFNNNFFDISLCNLVFAWNTGKGETEGLLREANRVTKKNGYVLMGLHSKQMNAEKEVKMYDALKEFGFKVITELSGAYKNKKSETKKFRTFVAVAQKLSAPREKINEQKLSFLDKVVAESHKEYAGRSEPGEFRLLATERFVKCEPWKRKLKDVRKLVEVYARKCVDAACSKVYDKYLSRDRTYLTDKIAAIVGLRTPSQLSPASKEQCAKILYVLNNGLRNEAIDCLRSLNITRPQAWKNYEFYLKETEQGRKFSEDELIKLRLESSQRKPYVINADRSYSTKIIALAERQIDKHLTKSHTTSQ
jgi:SNF2 family DNA or RNA helicase